jgi:hypothetical protein
MTARASDLAPRGEAEPGTWRGQAFGLLVNSPEELVGVPAYGAGEAGHTEVRFVTTRELDEAWGPESGTSLFARHYTDGRPYLTVDYKESSAYRIWADGHGTHLVADDGLSVLSAPLRENGWWWQRLVLAQVLPIAAAAQGIELLHASAVTLGGAAVAITAEAGTGKTTLAANLVDLGADLVADDVLALALGNNEIVAHPGVALVNIDPAQRSQLGERASARLAAEAGAGDKLYVLGELATEPSPLGAVYFLQRNEVREVEVAQVHDARKLLGSSFVPFLQDPRYLSKHLDVCSRIAAEIPVFALTVPRTLAARDIAAAVVRHGEAAW